MCKQSERLSLYLKTLSTSGEQTLNLLETLSAVQAAERRQSRHGLLDLQRRGLRGSMVQHLLGRLKGWPGSLETIFNHVVLILQAQMI